jgi:hypothetical protein
MLNKKKKQHITTSGFGSNSCKALRVSAIRCLRRYNQRVQQGKEDKLSSWTW